MTPIKTANTCLIGVKFKLDSLHCLGILWECVNFCVTPIYTGEVKRQTPGIAKKETVLPETAGTSSNSNAWTASHQPEID